MTLDITEVTIVFQTKNVLAIINLKTNVIFY